MDLRAESELVAARRRAGRALRRQLAPSTASARAYYRRRTMARRKRRDRAPARAPTTGGPAESAAFKLRVSLDSLEIAKGHDGLFRGDPEPVLALGVYSVCGDRVLSLGRALARLTPSGRFPAVVAPSTPVVVLARGRAAEGERVVILAVAIEEDSGAGVERVFASLSDGQTFRVWEHDSATPAPLTFAESATAALFPAPVGGRVHVLDDDVDLRDATKGDDFVGACLLAVATHRSEHRWRARFVSGDQRNDWTAVVDVRLS